MRNSSYILLRNVLKFYRFFGHSLKLCMWFRYNTQIIFVAFLQVELHFSGVITFKDKLQMTGDKNSLNLFLFVFFFILFLAVHHAPDSLCDFSLDY